MLQRFGFASQSIQRTFATLKQILGSFSVFAAGEQFSVHDAGAIDHRQRNAATAVDHFLRLDIAGAQLQRSNTCAGTDLISNDLIQRLTTYFVATQVVVPIAVAVAGAVVQLRENGVVIAVFVDGLQELGGRIAATGRFGIKRFAIEPKVGANANQTFCFGGCMRSINLIGNDLVRCRGAWK